MRELRTQHRFRRLSQPIFVAFIALWSTALTGACSTAPSGSKSSTSAGGGSAGTGAIGGAGGDEIDAGMGGGGTVDPPCVPGDGGIPSEPTAPDKLSATGLYTDIANQTLFEEVIEFEPVHPLWSDGATKRRFVYLPKCAKIDTSDMDNWSLPVGTRLWKEFSIGTIRVETRTIHRFGPGPDDFVFATYQWNDEHTEADRVLLGVQNAKATGYDIPPEPTCKTCHDHLSSRALGLSAIQLSHDGPGLTISALSEAKRLTVPAPDGFTAPGTPLESAALGYLHANCGNCHNPTGVQFVNPFSLWLSVNDTNVETTDTVVTAVGVPVEKFVHSGIIYRIDPGDSGSSCAYYRMLVRGTTEQMPPIASKIPDPAGLAAVAAWIDSL